MKAFAHRVMESEARYVTDAGPLTGTIHWYSGRKDVQTLEALKTELRRAWWTKAGEGRSAPLNERGYMAVAKMNNVGHMRAYMRRILNRANKKVLDESAFAALAPYYSGEVSVQSFDKLQQELISAPWVQDKEPEGTADPLVGEVVDVALLQDDGQTDDIVVHQGVGTTAPLTEEGYQQVAAEKSNKEMKAFAHRILNSEGRYSTDAGELTGAIHWYSGRMDAQNLDALKTELRRAWWTRAGEGRRAPLNEEGYQAVAKMNNVAHMRAYMRRILNHANKKAVDEAAFAALAPFYTGDAVQSFDKLQQELLAAPWVQEKPQDPLVNEVVEEMLLETGQKDVDTTGLGSTAPLTEEGYAQVAALASNTEMKAFAHRVLGSEARYVTDAGPLTGTIHWYSGRKDVQTLEALKAELRRAWWTKAGEGRSAPLNERGYQAVAKMNNIPHMRAYMRRILNNGNKKVVDEGAFAAMAPYYSGDIAVQNFDKLQEELLSAPWVQDKDEGDEIP